MRALASIAINYEEEVHFTQMSFMDIMYSLVRSLEERKEETEWWRHACIAWLQSDSSLSRSLNFCFSLVQFTNRDISPLLALLKAIKVYARFNDTYRYIHVFVERDKQQP